MRAFAVVDADTPDLPTIDLTATPSPGSAGSWTNGGTAAFDRRSFEERYAELGFGLGTVPRRLRRDDVWVETPVGMLGVILVLLVLVVWAATAG